MSDKELFHAAIRDLAAINECLGLDPDDGGAEPIISAIEELKAERDTACAANSEYCDKIAALEYSLKLDEELIGMIQRVITVLNNRPTPNLNIGRQDCCITPAAPSQADDFPAKAK